MEEYQPHFAEHKRKVMLLRNFHYYIQDGSDMLLSPNLENISFEAAWKWLESHGVSIHKSYADSITAYLANFEYKRESTLGKVVVYNPKGQLMLQKDALREIDVIRSTGKPPTKNKVQAIEDWKRERIGNETFQDWLLRKCGYL